MTAFETRSPIDNSVYVQRCHASAEDIALALSQAAEAQTRWQAIELSERQHLCRKLVTAIEHQGDAIGEELCWQMGRPLRFAQGELRGFAERAHYMIDCAESQLATITLPEKTGFTRYIKREPLGVVFVIAPWNYPYLTAVNAIVPALLAGNSVVLKHSAQTPLCAERLVEAAEAAGFPEGVFQYLHLSHEQTTALMQDARVKHVAFTGSVAGGQAVEQALAGHFKSVGLELGGKDPAYVRADADLDVAVETVIDGAFFNSGQSCCGIERAYVQEAVFDAFVEKAVALVGQYKLGDPRDPDTTLGPMVRGEAADFVRGQIAEAIAQGARALIDERDFPASQPGTAYLAPQLLINVDHSMRIMREESFGPVLGIQKVQDDDEAIALMNDSDFGLTASVFTRDQAAGIAIGERVETGTFFINRCDYLDPALAWTGVKQSGRGCTLSQLGFEGFTRPKSFHLKHAGVETDYE